MITDLMRYAGTAAKVRTLYGNRLTAEDFHALGSMKTIPEVTLYLQNHPGWRSALIGLNATDTHRNQLEDALHQGLLNEHLRIYNFVFSSGSELYQEPILRAEQDEILSCHRYIQTGGGGGYAIRLPAVFRKQSKIDFSALARCADWESLLAAISKTDYYPLLSRLNKPESGLPDYSSVEWVMQSYVYGRLFTIARRRASGQVKRAMESFIGAQVDLINIGRIMRIKKYFPEGWQEYVGLLLPFSGRIPPSFLKELYSAPDEKAAFQMLMRTPYKKVFEKGNFKYTEEYYHNFLFDFSRQMLRASIPSAFTAIAYLNLKEIELQNLIKVTECVRYSKTPESAGVFLVGISQAQ